ncbi:MAG: S24 family peptidase [Deltaproteobacteria bacterium]
MESVASAPGYRPGRAREAGPLLSPNTASGLSAAVVERIIGLPTGAWKKRHLYALRVMSETCLGLGAAKGDFLIVEPGRRIEAGRLVIVRDSEGIFVRRVRENKQGHGLVLAPPNPELLPFPTPARHRAVVGTVVGVVPAADKRQTRRLPSQAANRPRPAKRNAARMTSSAGVRHQRARSLGDPALARARAEKNLQLWRAWTAHTQARGQRRQSYWKRLEARLATLSNCMEGTGRNSLSMALAGEADSVARAMCKESRLSGRGGQPNFLLAGATRNS